MRILHQLAQEGQTLDQGVLAYLIPDLTAHMNHVGSYALNFDGQVSFPDYSMGLGVIAAKWHGNVAQFGTIGCRLRRGGGN
jgi:hypothetical protein